MTAVFYDQDAQCHECGCHLVLISYVQVCPDCDQTSRWPSQQKEHNGQG